MEPGYAGKREHEIHEINETPSPNWERGQGVRA